MQKAILGKKLGMTQVFDPTGKVIPVTVIEAGPCVVIQKKTVEADGYEAIQVGFAEVREKATNKPLSGHYKRAGQKPKKYLREFRLADTGSYEVGQEIKADVFTEGDLVDVAGKSRGKGFAGSIKRHSQSRGPMSHGSRYHRGPGSLGSIDPNRVFKGKPLPGRMGGERITAQRLLVVKVDTDRNLLLICGAVPGPRGGLVTIKNSAKATK